MSDKNLLSWMGFKKSDLPQTPASYSSASSSFESAASQPAPAAAPSSSTLERIRELESQLADLRSRRDITSLTKEEFEILATETAMNLIRTAQTREARAISTAQKAVEDAKRMSEQLRSDAETKAKGILSAAEGRGKKYVEAAESQARELLSQAQSTAESLLETKRRESAALATAAKREAERLIMEATSDVASFKNWLGTAISESERLHKIQIQSLGAAEEAIKQTRARLATAFEKLEALGADVSASLTADHRPVSKSFTRETVASELIKSSEDNSSDLTVGAATRAKAKPSSGKSSTSRSSKSAAATKKRTAAKRK